MQKRFIKLIAGIILCFFLYPMTAVAESTRQLIQSGNRAYQAGDYKKSLEDYDQAAAAEPDSPIILYNRGSALYKQKAYDAAIKTYEQAAIQAIQKGDPVLEAKSRFNMGNSAFQKAEILRSADLQKSLESYEQSAENYRAALRISPELSDAGHNLEMARQAANQVLSEMKKQEQLEQQMQDGQEQLSKELNDLVQEQQEAARKSNELAGSKQQKAATDNSQKSEKLADEQNEIQKRTEELATKFEQLSEQQVGQPGGEKARKHLNRAMQEQQQAENRLRDNFPEQARKNQEKAAAEMLQALNDMDRQQEQQGDQKPQHDKKPEQQESSQAQNKTAQTGDPKKEEHAQEGQMIPAERTAQKILNEEEENRKNRQGSSARSYQPVDKDW